MSDLIRREDAIDGLMQLHEAHKADRFTGDLLHWTGIKAMLNGLPSAEPERHRGEWIKDDRERGFSECSKCGYIAVSVLSERHYSFCPQCGADMRGIDE